MFSASNGVVLHLKVIGSSQEGHPKYGATSTKHPDVKFRINLSNPGVAVNEAGVYLCEITGELPQHNFERRVLVSVKCRVPDLTGVEVVFHRRQRRDRQGTEYQTRVDIGGRKIIVVPLREDEPQVQRAFKKHGKTHGSCWKLGSFNLLVDWVEGKPDSMIIAASLMHEVSMAYPHHHSKEGKKRVNQPAV